MPGIALLLVLGLSLVVVKNFQSFGNFGVQKVWVFHHSQQFVEPVVTISVEQHSSNLSGEFWLQFVNEGVQSFTDKTELLVR